MKKIKVIVTDDSIFMRKLITDLLHEHPIIEVVATAKNGLEAIHKTKELSPDVITLDVEMPVMNGLQALQEIMSKTPIPVIMLSSTTSEGSANTILAMEQGAVDFVAKPSGSISLDIRKVKEELIEKILSAAKSNIASIVYKEKRVRKTIPKRGCRELNKVSVQVQRDAPIVCIGASTGGPRALQTLLTSLPKSFPAPIFIVQHMPKQFTKSLAERLDSLCEITMYEAVHNQKVKDGAAYIAPGGFHMEVGKRNGSLSIQLTEAPPVMGHRPSVDVLFTSISSLKNCRKIGVVLTGMGRDGSIGIKELKKMGNSVAIVESEESSIVFGMPNAAIQTGLVDETHHIEDIADRIQQYTLS